MSTDWEALSRELEKFLVGREFAVFAGVMQGHVGVGSAVEGINFATGVGMGVNVKAGGALVEFGKIENLMNGLFALDGAGMVVIHIVGDTRRNVAGAASVVLIIDAEILDAQFADGHGHPAILPAMIVNAAGLADFPTDGDDFEEAALEDEIPRVMAFGVEEVGLEGFDANLVLLEVFFDFRKSEIFAMNGGKAVDPLIDCELRHRASFERKSGAGRKYSAGEGNWAEKNVSVGVLR